MNILNHKQFILYLILTAFIVLISNFIGQIHIPLGLFIAMGILFLFIKADIIYHLPLLMFAPFIIGSIDQLPILMYFYISYLIILIIALVKLHQIRYIGSLGIALLFLIDAAALSLLNAPSFLVGIQGILILFSGFFVYFFFINTLKPSDHLIEDLAWHKRMNGHFDKAL